jgi:hypothetical protein
MLEFTAALYADRNIDVIFSYSNGAGHVHAAARTHTHAPHPTTKFAEDAD